MKLQTIVFDRRSIGWWCEVRSGEVKLAASGMGRFRWSAEWRARRSLRRMIAEFKAKHGG